MANDNIATNRQKLYNAAKDRFTDIGTFDEFNEKMNDEAKRRKFYNAMQSQFTDIGTWEEFNAKVYSAPNPAQPAPQQTTQPTQPTAQSTQADEATDATSDANEDEQPAQTGWKPSYAQQFAWTQFMMDSQKRFKAMSDKTKRMTMRYTPEGRKQLKTAEQVARMNGTPTSPSLFKSILPSMDYSGAPVPYGVVTENGQKKTQWLLSDGTLTTDYGTAYVHDAIARQKRLQHQFEMRMKANGYDISKKDDVQKQAQIDAIVSGIGFDAKTQQEIESDLKQHDLDPRNAQHVYWYINGDVRSIMAHKLEVAEAKLKQLNQSKEQKRQARDKKAADEAKQMGFFKGMWHMMTQGGHGNTYVHGAGQMPSMPSARQMGTAYTQEDVDIENLTAEVAKLRKDINEYDQKVSASGKGWFGKVAQGLWDGVTSPSSWTAGIYDLSIASTARNASLADDNGRRLLTAFNLGKQAEQKLETEGYNPGGWYSGGHFVGEMLSDPVTYVSAGVGSGARNIATKGLTKATMNAVEKTIAERLLTSRLGSKILLKGVESGANFATFEGLRDMRQQIIDGGYYDSEGNFHEGFSFGHMASQAGHGAIMGTTIGVFGAGIGNIGEHALKYVDGKVSQGWAGAAARGGTRLTTTGVSVLSEGTIFAVPEIYEFHTMNDEAFDKLYAEKFGYAGETDPKKRAEARDKARNSMQWHAWTESMANIAGMKLAGPVSHAVQNPKGIIGHVAGTLRDLAVTDSRNHTTFVERLNTRLGQVPSDAFLTKYEREELKRKGYGKLSDLFVKDKANAQNEDGELVEVTTESSFDGYTELEHVMADPTISQAARAKLYYIFTGNMLPMGTVAGWRVNTDAKGRTIVESTTASGEVVTSRSFASAKDAGGYINKIKRQVELNTVDIGEQFSERNADEQLINSACEKVAQELPYSTTPDAVKKIFLRSTQEGVELTEGEKSIIEKVEIALEWQRDVPELTALRPENMRKQIKEDTGVDIDAALRKQEGDRTQAEKEAVERYLRELYPQPKGEDAPRRWAYAEQMIEGDGGDPLYDNNGGSPLTPFEQEVQEGLHEDGNAYLATMKADDRRVTIVKGRVVFTDDGTMINTTASDKVLWVRDLETGKVESTSPDQIMVSDMDILSADRYSNWRKWEKAQGMSLPNVGEKFEIFFTDEENNGYRVTAELKEITEDGECVIEYQTNDGTSLSVKLESETLKSFIFNAAEERLKSGQTASHSTTTDEQGLDTTLPKVGESFEMWLEVKENGETIPVLNKCVVDGINEDGSYRLRITSRDGSEHTLDYTPSDISNVLYNTERIRAKYGLQEYKPASEVVSQPTSEKPAETTSTQDAAPVKINYDVRDSFRVAVKGSTETQHAAVMSYDRASDTVELWTPLPMIDTSSKARTIGGYTTLIAREYLEKFIERDENGNPKDYVPVAPKAEEKAADETSASDRGAEFDKGYTIGVSNAEGYSDEQLNQEIEKLRTEPDLLTDTGRGYLQGLEYEQQRRAMERKSQEPTESTPNGPASIQEAWARGEVQLTAPAESGNNTSENIPQNGNIEGENILASPETAVNPTENATSQAQPQAETTPAVEPMPMRKMSEKDKKTGKVEEWEEPDYLATTPQCAHSYIYNESGLSRADANTHVEENLKDAQDAVAKHAKSAPKIGKQMGKYQMQKAKWEQEGVEKQKAVDFWEQVKAEQAKVVAAEREVQRQRDAEAYDAAQARFEERQRIKAEKEAEQAAIGTHAVNPKLTEKYQSKPRHEGNEDIITLPDGTQIIGRYILTESGAATPSHDVNNYYQPTEGFPIDKDGQSVNDRDYAGDRDAQRIVEQIADNYDSRALQDPVVVTKDGIVLSGNNRTMSGEIAARQGSDKAYTDYLRQYAHKYGFTPEQVDAYQHPRVVFETSEDLPLDASTFARFNAQEKKTMSKPEQAVKLGKTVPDDAFATIADLVGQYSRMGDFYANETSAAQALGALYSAGVINDKQLPELRTGTSLSAAGRELLENALLGKIFQGNPDAVRMLMEMPTLKESIVMSMAEIAANHKIPNGFDLSEELAKAVDLAYRAKKSDPDVYKEGVPVSPFGRHESLFAEEYGSTIVKNAAILLLADALNSKKPTDLRNILTLYNKESNEAASGQMDLWSGTVPTPEEVMQRINEHFNKLTPDEKQKLVDQSRAEAQRTAKDAIAERAEGSPQDLASVGRSGGERNIERGGEIPSDIETKKSSNEKGLTRQEATAIIAEMEERAEVAPEIELNIQNWDAEFGEDGIVHTPLGEVKMGENQFTKLMRQGRNGKLGMIKPTLESPDIIIEDFSEAKEGDTTERNSSYVFVKTFVKADGSRYYYFTSVTVSKDGHEVVVSNQEKRRNVLTNLLLKGKMVWKHADDVSSSSDVEDGLYSPQGKMSDPVTEGTDAPQTNISADKVSTSSADKQEKSAESSPQLADVQAENGHNEPRLTVEQILSLPVDLLTPHMREMAIAYAKGSNHPKAKKAHDHVVELLNNNTTQPVQKEHEGYTLDTYTTKPKANSKRQPKAYHRVQFPRVDKETWAERLAIGKEQFGGTSVPGGYGFKDEATAKAFAEAILHPTSAEKLSEHTDKLALAEKSEQPKAESAQKEAPKAERKRNKWVAEEDQDEAEELLKKIKARLRGNMGRLNSGMPVDAELLMLGTRYGYLIVKNGVRKFADFAKSLMETVGEEVRPYVRSWYSATMMTEEAINAGWFKEMTPLDEVAKFDMANFMKEKPATITETAKEIAKEQEVKGAQPKAATDAHTVIAGGIKRTEGDFVPQPKGTKAKANKERNESPNLFDFEDKSSEVRNASNQPQSLKGVYTSNDKLAFMARSKAGNEMREDIQKMCTRIEDAVGGDIIPYNDKMVKHWGNHGYSECTIAFGEGKKETLEIQVHFTPKEGQPFKEFKVQSIEVVMKGNPRKLVFEPSVPRDYLLSQVQELAGIKTTEKAETPTTVKSSEKSADAEWLKIVEMAERGESPYKVTRDVEKELVAQKHGFKIGDTVIWDDRAQKPCKATIIDVDESGRPILDTGMMPVVMCVGEWKELTKQESEGAQAQLPAKPKKELAGDSATKLEAREKEHKLVDLIQNTLAQRSGDKPLTIKDIRKIAEECGLTDISPTDLQELTERAVSLHARSIAEKTITGDDAAQKNGFDQIVSLYETQPNLADRDVERMQKQQFSTPTPMGYVMNQFLLSKGFNGKRLLEPSAGNGALTIGIPKADCRVNDIDARRLANLRAMGYPTVTAQDALMPFEGVYDMVATNPPFGAMPKRTYDNGLFEIGTLEGQMAINALESMHDNGRAAIIIGGSIGNWPTPYESNGRLKKLDDRQFFGYLYSHFNVVDIIPIDGKKLYSRNGTGYNVRMILLDGRRRDAEGNVIREVSAETRQYPPVFADARPEAVRTYEELYKRVQDDISSIQGRLDDADSGDGIRPSSDGERDTRNSASTDRTRGGLGQQSMGDGELGGTARSGLGRGHSESVDAGLSDGRGRGSNRGGLGGGNRRTDRQGDANAGTGDGSALDAQQNTRGSRDVLRAGQTVDRPGGRGGIRDRRADTDGLPLQPQTDGTRQRGGNGLQRLTTPKPVKVELTDEKVATPHISASANLMSRMPAAQAHEFENALHTLEAKHGDIDEYLVSELGYADKEELYRSLAAEQVEGVAMAIDKMAEGRGFIIADQTGIGKGRQAASIIRYAVRQGKKPIFFTQKPGLFSDMYRDLQDVGSKDLRPFIFGSDKDANITERQADGTDKVIYRKPSEKERDRVFSYVEQHGELPPEYDYAVCTYSQVQNGTTEYSIADNGKIEAKPKAQKKSQTGKSTGSTKGEINGERRREVIKALINDNYLILDESHTAGGASNLGGYMQSLIPNVRGITYLSATYAKRPDNMPLYAIKTAISECGVETADLIQAVNQGGVPLQEIMSRQLVKSGEMVRRERDFTGVTIDWIPADEGMTADQQGRFDTVSSIFVDIMNFQDMFVKPYLDNMSGKLALSGSIAQQKKGTKSMGINNPPFASKLYNLLQQLLFSIKVDAVADRAIKNLQSGRKPIISFVNTMEGFLEDAAQGMSGNGSESIPTLSLALRKALDGVMRYTIKDDQNKETHFNLDLEEMGPGAVEMYNQIVSKMQSVSSDLPIAPLDAIRLKIEAAGYRVGELSGRKLELTTTSKGRYIIRNRKVSDKKAIASDFNEGKIDVVLVNKTGSTGISLHASEKFADRRQRVMIAAQFQPDVNDEVQMRGRNDRTGQVVRGAYEYLMSSIPAEQRLQMMFKAKLKSLDANTTSSQKSSFNEMDVVDVLNKYGDAIVWEYLSEDAKGLNMRMGNPLGIDATKSEEEVGEALVKESNKKPKPDDDGDGAHSGFARKALGRLALLSIAEQEQVMADISDRYQKKIHELDERGENDLEISYRDLKAKTLGRSVWIQGSDPSGENAFSDNVYMEKVEVNILDKPLTHSELTKYHKTFLDDAGVKTWDEWVQKKTAEIDAAFEQKIATSTEIIRSNKEATITRRIDRFIVDAKKARAAGKNSLSDEEILAEAHNRFGEKERQEAAEAIEAKRQTLERQRDTMKERIARYKALEPLIVPEQLLEEGTFNMEPTIGVLVGIKLDNKFTMNGSQVVFATLDGRRTVTLSLKEAANAFNKISYVTRINSDVLSKFDLSQWDSKISKESREQRYMLTGNILRALVDVNKTASARGRITTYTTDSGEVRTGILMSSKFEPKDLQTSSPISSALDQIKHGHEVKSANGEVTIRRSRRWSPLGEYELLVPKSKQRGGKYYFPDQDPKLARLASSFDIPRSGSQAIAHFHEENLARLLDHLSTKHGLTVMHQSKLKETNEDGIEYRTSQEGIDYINARDVQPWRERLDKLRFKQNQLGYSLTLGERAELHELSLQEKMWEQTYNANHTDTQVETGRKSRFDYYAEAYGQGGLSAGLHFAKEEVGSLYTPGTYHAPRYISASARDLARKAIPLIERRRQELLGMRKQYSRAGQHAIDGELAELEYMTLDYQRMEDGEEVTRTMRGGRLEHQRKLNTAHSFAAELGEKVVVYEAVSDIHDTDYSRLQRKRRSFGWHNPNDGSIHINLPMHATERDVVRTVLHEVIGHKTLEQIMGAERFARFIDEVWNHAGKKLRANISHLMGKHKWDYKEATKEYIAQLAEEVHEKGAEYLDKEQRGLWNRVKAKIADFFNRILEGLKIPARIRINDEDLLYMLWKLYQRQKRKTAGKPVEGDIFDKAEEMVRTEQWKESQQSMEIVARDGERDMEKAERIKRLRESESVEISGDEIPYSKDLRQYKKNAIEYGKTLQGEYVNEHTGNSIQLQRGRRNGGLKEILQHDLEDDSQIKSIAALPEIIKKGTYIDSYPNRDTEKNPDVAEYQHYVCGLRIGNEDYTAHSIVAVDKKGNRYYDHKLSHIEKGKLLDFIEAKQSEEQILTPTSGTKPTIRSLRKVKELISLLQVDGDVSTQSIHRDSQIEEYRLREKPAPSQTIDVYKLMRLTDNRKPGALFIDSATELDFGNWYDADSPDLSMLKGLEAGQYLVNPQTKEVVSRAEFNEKHTELASRSKYPSKAAINYATENGLRWMVIEETEKAQRRFDGEHRKYWNLGINGSGTVSTFSMRPGWHAASLPTMRQIGKGKDKNLRDDNFVWVKGKMSADIDYNAEAQRNPDKDLPDRIPEDGFYMKATNADAAKSQADRVGWYVGGAFMPERFMSDAEAREVIDKFNAEHPDITPVEYDYERESGRQFDPEQGLHFRDGDGMEDKTVEERTLELSIMLADRHRNDVAVRDAAIEGLGKTLSDLRKAMDAQKTYDYNIVHSLSTVADILISSGTFLPEGPGEVKRLCNIMKKGVGHTYTDKDGTEKVVQSEADWNRAVERLMDLFVDNQLKLSERFLDETMKIRGSKVNARGVEVQGELDVEGQHTVRAMRENMKVSANAIRERISDLDDIIVSGSEAASIEAAAQRIGAELALQHAEEVRTREEEEKKMRDELRDMKATWRADMSGDERTAYMEQKKALREAIRKLRVERADALRSLASQVGNELRNSVERAREFRDREKARIEEIRHNANSDMQGRPFDEHGKKKFKTNNVFMRLFMAPAATFEQMMRVFGSKSIDGEGYLFDRFVRGWQKCRDTEWQETQKTEDILNRRAAQFLSKHKAKWSDLYKLSTKAAGSCVWFDGGKMKEHKVTQGNLMYIYMANKMTDGRVKLRRMGITEEKMAEIEAQLDPILKDAADWIQEELLPELRVKYNEVHKRMFGAPMAEIENYFPLKILSNALMEEYEIGDGKGTDGQEMPKIMTGAIIKRKYNNCALDILGSDAISVTLDHIREMETWSAFAEYRRDLGTLLSYKRFRNQVKNMTTIYGGGEKLWKKFFNLSMLVGGAYQPKVSSFDKHLVNLTKLAAGACIAIRLNTAIKQFLSYPAFASDANIARMMYNLTPWRARKCWMWAMENMPAFQRRWQSRQGGNDILREWKGDWDWTKSDFVQKIQRAGITPNAFVDALTIAMGAEAIYNKKYKRYIKDGFSKEQAHEKALQDAEIVFNLSQQSSEVPYLSLLQNDRSYITTAVTNFRNSPMSYLRQSIQSKRELVNAIKHKQEQIEFETKKGIREGLSEHQAYARAKRKYNRNFARNLVKSATFDFVLPSLWTLGLTGMWYLIFGDDDEKKKQYVDESIKRGALGPMEGMTFGGTVPDLFYAMLTKGEYTINEESSPGAGLIMDMLNLWNNGKQERAANETLNTLVALGVGMNPQVIEDVIVAAQDYFSQDEKTSRDFAILFMRVISCPQSQIDQVYFDELGLDARKAQRMSPAQLAERYATYKAKRQNFATMWAYDEERWESVKDVWRKKFNKEAKARLEKLNTEEVNNSYTAYDEEYTQTRREIKQLDEGTNVIDLAKRADALFSSPKGQRYFMFKEVHPFLEKMIKSWLNAQTPGEAQANATDVVTIKALIVEMLDKVETDMPAAQEKQREIMSIYANWLDRQESKQETADVQ